MLDLEVVLVDVRSFVVGQPRKHADVLRIVKVDAIDRTDRERAGSETRIERAVRRTARERDADAVTVVELREAAVGRVLRKLVVDAAAVEEVEESVAAANDRLAVAGQVISKAEPRAEVVRIRLGQRIIRISCNDQPSGVDVKVSLAAVHLGRVGEILVTKSEVERKAVRHTPVVLYEQGIFPVAGSDRSERRADLVVADKTDEKVSLFPTGCRSTAALRRVAVADQEEVSFAAVRTIKSHVSAKDRSAELEGMVAGDVAHTVNDLIGRLRYEIRAEVAGVLKLAVVAADECSAAEVCIAVRVQDAKVRRDRLIKERRRVAVANAVDLDAELVKERRRKSRVQADDRRAYGSGWFRNQSLPEEPEDARTSSGQTFRSCNAQRSDSSSSG